MLEQQQAGGGKWEAAQQLCLENSDKEQGNNSKMVAFECRVRAKGRGRAAEKHLGGIPGAAACSALRLCLPLYANRKFVAPLCA